VGETIIKTKNCEKGKHRENEVVKLANKYFITANGSHLYNADSNSIKLPSKNASNKANIDENIKQDVAKWFSGYEFYSVPIFDLDKNKIFSNKVTHVLMEKTLLISPSQLLDYIVPDHLDGVKTNNNWINLEWVTQVENVVRANGQPIYGYYDSKYTQIYNTWPSINKSCPDLRIPSSTIRGQLKNGKAKAFIGIDKKTIIYLKK